MVTKQEVTDYINANITDALSSAEIAMLRTRITPALATVLIKLLGDVSLLIEIRDGA